MGWFDTPPTPKTLSPEAQGMADFLMDAAVGMAPERRPVRTTVQRRIKVSRADMLDYCADMDAQWRIRKVAAIKNRNQRSR